jgi:hypothetical protein
MSRSPSHRSGRRAARLAAIAAGALLLLAACGAGPTTTPAPTPSPTASPAPATAAPTSSATPAPSDDLAALYREIEDQVVAERGLEAKERRDPVVLSEEELRVRIEEQFRAENPPEEIAVAQETLQALGLLPADADLEQLYVDMLSSQVAGFYDTETKELFVVSRSGSIGPAEKVTYAHEFTHALQDQHFGLEGIDVDAVGQGDRSLGRLALVEGDATLLMTRWMVEHLTPEELQELLKVDPDDLAQLEALPAILRETLLFPYQQGGVFANGIWMAGGWEAIDGAYGRLPDSTEQILHLEKYEAGEKPVAVDLDGAALAGAMGAGWSGTPEDTLGEFQLSVWLRENGVKALDAQRAAAGWGGDRIAYLRGPDGAYALAIATTWDAAGEADEFVTAATAAATNLPGAARVERGEDDRSAWVFVASDAPTLAQLAGAARGLGI